MLRLFSRLLDDQGDSLKMRQPAPCCFFVKSFKALGCHVFRAVVRLSEACAPPDPPKQSLTREMTCKKFGSRLLVLPHPDLLELMKTTR